MCIGSMRLFWSIRVHSAQFCKVSRLATAIACFLLSCRFPGFGIAAVIVIIVSVCMTVHGCCGIWILLPVCSSEFQG